MRPSEQKTVSLRRLDASSEEYAKVTSVFTEQWIKESPQCPAHSAVIVIRNSNLSTRYHKYVERLRTSLGKESEIECHFHGTKLMCNILTTNTCCDSAECGICGIITKGFNLSFVGKNIPHFQRYGRGIYLAPNSSKAHGYAKPNPNTGLQAQLLCFVACGNKYVLHTNDRDLISPPLNYHSVYGQASTSGPLNFDEVVLYTADAILPTYVILYHENAQISRMLTTATDSTSRPQMDSIHNLQSLFYNYDRQLLPEQQSAQQKAFREQQLLSNQFSSLNISSTANRHSRPSSPNQIEQCTYCKYGKELVSQVYYTCSTCWGFDGGFGCCKACASSCHKGHKLDEKYGLFYCDCGDNNHQPGCTRNQTGQKLYFQPFYKCHTCFSQPTEGVCYPCVVHCHSGHNIAYIGLTGAFCDCGPSCRCKIVKSK